MLILFFLSHAMILGIGFFGLAACTTIDVKHRVSPSLPMPARGPRWDFAHPAGCAAASSMMSLTVKGRFFGSDLRQMMHGWAGLGWPLGSFSGSFSWASVNSVMQGGCAGAAASAASESTSTAVRAILRGASSSSSSAVRSTWSTVRFGARWGDGAGASSSLSEPVRSIMVFVCRRVGRGGACVRRRGGRGKGTGS